MHQQQGAEPVIIIDPGHGGTDEGAKGCGLLEKDLALDISLRVEKLLRAQNVNTVLTRRTDVYVTLTDRALVADSYEHAFFVSIHFNQSRQNPAVGVETFYASEKIVREAAWSWLDLIYKPKIPPPDNGATLASSIQTALASGLGTTSRGTKARDLFVVCNTHCPAVLVEGGFLSNPAEAKLLKDESYRERMAASIVHGIMDRLHAEQNSNPAVNFAKAKN